MKYYAKFLLLAVGFSIILYGLRSYMSADGLSIQHYIVYNHCGELIKFTTAEMVPRCFSRLSSRLLLRLHRGDGSDALSVAPLSVTPW